MDSEGEGVWLQEALAVMGGCSLCEWTERRACTRSSKLFAMGRDSPPEPTSPVVPTCRPNSSVREM